MKYSVDNPLNVVVFVRVGSGVNSVESDLLRTPVPGPSPSRTPRLRRRETGVMKWMSHDESDDRTRHKDV